MKMRCCVPFCKNTSDNVSTSEAEGKGISFHGFPSEVHLRAAWLRALGKQDSHLPGSAVVCSQHFLSDDIYETESGRQIVTGAVPSTVQVCMICLDTDTKMFLMSKHRLEEAYEKLTGHPAFHPGNLKQAACVQCAQRLINFSRFRDKSLRARALMTDLVEKHELITRQHVTMINRTKHQLKSNMVLTTLGPDHCDLHILEHSSEDKQTELEETGHRVVVKTEGSDDSMSVDEDMGVINEEDNNVDDFVQDPLKYESVSITFQCTLCVEEFVHEHAYMRHMSMHLQDGAGDGECDTSQVCKPHAAVSSSSSHSSLITEDKQPDPSPAAHAAHASVAPSSAGLAADNENEPRANEESNAVGESKPLFEIDSDESGNQTLGDNSFTTTTNIPRSTSRVVKLDISKKPKHNVQIQDECLNRTRKAISFSDSQNTDTDSKDKTYNPAASHSKNIASDTGKRKVKLFSCTLCDYKCKQNKSLLRHSKKHTGEMPYNCRLCEYKSSSKTNYVIHMKTHTGEKPFSCNICQFQCVRKDGLEIHMRTHTGEKPYICTLCGYRCPRKHYLVSHLRTHTGEKPYSCEVCERMFASKSTLADHARTHTGEKPFACKLCDSKFTHRGTLKTHMRTHTGEKPYSCTVCEHKFLVKSHLVTHMRTHTGEKPFACKICNKKFAHNSHLVTHMRTHTGEKPYACTRCELKCARRSTLATHMRTHR